MTSVASSNRNDLFSFIFSDDVEIIERRSYEQASVYKYYHFSEDEALRAFFARPTLKFTHKDDLNDPFELSRRWKKFGYPLTDKIAEKYVLPRLRRRLLDIRNIRKKMLRDPRAQGLGISRQQRRKVIATKVKRAQIEAEMQAQVKNIRAIDSLLPATFRDHEEEFIEEFGKSTGILSLTEDINNARMWQDYAANGYGFALEFDAGHPFFFHYERGRRVRQLLRKVLYRDDQIEDFWINPYYLFLVKEKKWDFEREWRVLKNLDQCELKMTVGGRAIYVLDMPSKLIKSVIFGNMWDPERAAEYGSIIRGYDPSIGSCIYGSLGGEALG